MELVREAISNAVDWDASNIRIRFAVKQIDGVDSLVVTLEDDGAGMTYESAKQDFWGLGYSSSRDDKEKIGEKGHGTKIFLRSRQVLLKTQSSEGAYEAICDMPLAALSRYEIHTPRIRTIEEFQPSTGTNITILGYNNDERSRFIQSIVKDYIHWFTQVGSIENEFGIDRYKDFKVYLWCIDVDEYEEIDFGHVFPKENSNINKLFDELGADAADAFCKKYAWEGRLTRHPEVSYQCVIYVEGDDVKRTYNDMLRQRSDIRRGTYRVSDRYGIWLTKDFIPVQRVNEWITGFGSGSNAFVLLHGFVNCQRLKLTANRGNISNTDPHILEEIKEVVQTHVEEVDTDLKKRSLYILRSWQREQTTIEQEERDYISRLENIKKQPSIHIEDRIIIEPQSESELFGAFITIYSLHPKLFEFEPLDYNTFRGIDNIARIKGSAFINEGEYGYIELKHTLKTNFNHAFRFLKWIICWDFHKDITRGTQFVGVEEDDVRSITFEEDDDGNPAYFLDAPNERVRIQIIRLKELLINKLDLEFK